MNRIYTFSLLALASVQGSDDTTNYPPSVEHFLRTKRLRQFVDETVKQGIMSDPMCADLRNRIQILVRAVPKFNMHLQQGVGDLNRNTRKRIISQFTAVERAHWDAECSDSAMVHKQFIAWSNEAQPYSPYCKNFHDAFVASGMHRKPIANTYLPVAKQLAKFIIRNMDDVGALWNACNPRRIFCAKWNQAIMNGEELTKDELKWVRRCSHNVGQSGALKSAARQGENVNRYTT